MLLGKFLSVVDALLILPMDKWAVITSEEIYHQLEAVCANEASVYASNHGTTDGLQANAAYFKQKNSKTKQTGSTSETPCFNFAKGKACRNNPCNFSHQQPEQKSVKQNSTFSPAPPPLLPHHM